MVKTTAVDIRIDRNGPVPISFQVARELEAAIADGRLPRGAYLDNELALAERWQISRLTLRRAIGELVESGLLVRRRGIGTKVVSDQLPKPHRLGSLHDDLVARNEVPRTTVLAADRVVADDHIADQLDLAPGSTIVYLERCRHLGDRRLALLRDWLTPTAFGTITPAELISHGLFELMRREGVWPHSAERKVGARIAGPVDAALLGLPVGAPLLTVASVMLDRAGVRINVSEQIHDGSDYTLELRVVES